MANVLLAAGASPAMVRPPIPSVGGCPQHLPACCLAHCGALPREVALSTCAADMLAAAAPPLPWELKFPPNAIACRRTRLPKWRTL